MRKSRFQRCTGQFWSNQLVIVVKRITNISFKIVETFVLIASIDASNGRISYFEESLGFSIFAQCGNNVSNAVLDSSGQISSLLWSNESGIFPLRSLKLSF